MNGSIYLGKKFNEFGTEVSVHKCKYCGTEFTLCPAAPDWSGGCMHIECKSYVKECDVDRLFESNPNIIKQSPTGRLN